MPMPDTHTGPTEPYGRCQQDTRSNAGPGSRQHQGSRHQPAGTTPEELRALTRHAERLEAQYRRLQRAISERAAVLASTNQTETPTDREDKRLARATGRAAAKLRAQIAAAGGIPTDHLNAQVGDVVRIAGFTGTVVRVNPTTYTIRASREGHRAWTVTLDRTQLSAILHSAKRATAADQTNDPQPA